MLRQLRSIERFGTLKAKCRLGWIGLDRMVILYTVTPRASLQSDAKNLNSPRNDLRFIASKETHLSCFIHPVQQDCFKNIPRIANVVQCLFLLVEPEFLPDANGSQPGARGGAPCGIYCAFYHQNHYR